MSQLSMPGGKVPPGIKPLHPLSHFQGPVPLAYLLLCPTITFSRTPHRQVPSRPPHSRRAIPHAFPINPVCTPTLSAREPATPRASKHSSFRTGAAPQLPRSRHTRTQNPPASPTANPSGPRGTSPYPHLLQRLCSPPANLPLGIFQPLQGQPTQPLSTTCATAGFPGPYAAVSPRTHASLGAGGAAGSQPAGRLSPRVAEQARLGGDSPGRGKG